MRLIIVIALSVVFIGHVQAEDWTTTDGKTFQNVKVIKVEDDAVTIMDKDGGALVPLATLPPDLQKQFHYDPAKAQAAAAARQKDEQAAAQALEDQKKARLAQAEQVATQPVKPEVTASTLAPNPVPAPTSTPAPTPSPATPSLAIADTPATSTTTTKPSTSSPEPSGGQFSLNKGTGAVAAGTEVVNPNWKLVWSDEFNGPEIDKSKWDFEIDGKGGGNGEEEYYTAKPENAHIEDGILKITAIKDGTDAEGKKHKFTSARMVTKGKFSWKYGRFEARIRMPIGQGVWPAFWLMPQDNVYGGWASSGELDIVEMIGKSPDTAYGTIHYGDKWPKNVHTGDKIVLPSGTLHDDFHVYAVEWQEGVIRWYFDGQLYETQTKWYTKAAPFPAPFDQNFFIILNFAVGGAWPGKPSSSTVFPQSMDVDYVRVYQP